MGCCGQNPVGAGAVAVDGCKRVNYTLGMLLGVDDFVQESAYHTARRHALAREVLGYGTVRGLDVVIERDGDNGPRLRVTPGAAWLPSGTPICVETDQCCNLNDWLAARAMQVQQALAHDSPPADILLHVVLSYASCLTDNVIIPGEPCRSDDELMQPSRVADSFRLELRLDAPLQREEDAIRDFVEWLSGVRVAADSPPLDETSFIEQLKAAAHAWLVPGSPPMTPDDFMVGTPPDGLRADDGLRRAALRLWVTELRPLWTAHIECGCGRQSAGADDAVLLATLRVPLVSTGAGVGWRVGDAPDMPVTIDQRRRPVLLSLRMVQELIDQRSNIEAGDSVVPADAFGLLPVAGTADEYSRADHGHGTPELPPLSGDLEGLLGDDASTSPPEPPRVVGLRGQPIADVAPAEGNALLFEAGEWTPGPVISSLPELSGDLAGELGGVSPSVPRVVGLQGQRVAPTGPGEGQVLTFIGGEWVPGDVTARVPDLSGDLSGTLGASGAATPRVSGLQGSVVAATAPAEGQVLIFSGGQWVPGSVSVPAGDFVGRNREPFEIVAAGEIVFTPRAGGGTFGAGTTYGGLRGTSASGGSDPQRMLLDLQATVPNATSLPNYIVKLTPMLPDDRVPPFRLFLRVPVKPARNAIAFTVLLLGDQSIVDGSFEFHFQVEVSRFRSN